MEIGYLAGSLAGIALLVALCAMLFGTTPVRLTEPQALDALRVEGDPAFRVRSVAVAEDGAAALAQNDRDGAIHVVVARGDVLVTRKLSRALVRAVAHEGAVLSLTFTDFTLPRATLLFHDAEEARLWQSRIAEAVR